MRTRRVRLDGDTYTSPRGRGGDTPGACNAVQGSEEPRRRACRPTIPASTPQERTRGRPGLPDGIAVLYVPASTPQERTRGRPAARESAGAYLEHPGNRLAPMRSAAGCNSAAGLGAARPARGTSPPRPGFQARPPQLQQRARPGSTKGGRGRELWTEPAYRRAVPGGRRRGGGAARGRRASQRHVFNCWGPAPGPSA